MKIPRHSRKFLALAGGLVALAATALSAQAQIQVLIESGEVWKYNDSGTIQSASDIIVGDPRYTVADWKHPNFNDAAWQQGNATLGYGDSDTVTTISFGGNAGSKIISYYFRREFNIANLADFTNDFNALEVLLRRDDGAVVYVNGREVARDNMPNGVVNQNTLAINGIGGADEQRFFLFRVTSGLGTILRTGRNVIAVEVHQNSPSSSDLGFDVKLQATSVETDFGVARPPIFTDFDPPETQTDSSRHIRREVVDEDGDIEWEAKYQSGPTFTDPTASFFDDVALDNNSDQALSFFAVRGFMETEPIDLRSFVDIAFSFAFRTYTEDFGGGVASFESNDFARVTLKFSTDGVNFGGDTVIFDSNGAGQTGIDYVDIIPEEAPKTAIVPTSESDPSGDWKALAYDDSAWLSGTKGVGLESSPGGASSYDQLIGIDVKDAMLGINESVYLRVPFMLNRNPSTIEQLVLKMQFDDGFVAYINGQEIARENAPVGTPAWNAGATASNADTRAVAGVDFNITSQKNVLVQGQNILAIHGLNRGIGSSDMLILPTLRIGQPKPPNEGSLGFYDKGFDGEYTTIMAPVDAIPIGAQSMKIRVDASCGDGNLVPSPEGIYFNDFAITGTPRYPDSYPNWIMLQSNLEGEDALPLADPDADGLINILEYAFGGDPEFPDKISGPGSLLPTFQLDINGFLNVTYRQLNSDPLYPVDPDRDPLPEGSPRRGILAADLRYVVEQSIDARDWRTGAVGGVQLVVVGEPTDNGDERTVTVRLRSVSPIELGNPNLFWRLKVSIEPAPSYLAQ